VQRLVDMLPVVRGSIYHPDFHFSASIKTVGPTLRPDVTYADLQEIADGDTDSTALWLMESGQTGAEIFAPLRRSLRQYCPRGHVGDGPASPSLFTPSQRLLAEPPADSLAYTDPTFALL
jgi:hypothetical protein